MTRLNKYTRSLVSGYASLGVNTLFTLVSVPLALKYLSTVEFGLWALASQVAGYLALVDFGMSGAQSRILIDYKDETAGTNYGSTILTGLMVGLTQGLVLLAAGSAAMWCMGSLPKIPAALDGQMRWLMTGQCAITGVTLVTRAFGNVLWAHQRTDLANLSQILLTAVNFGVMWLSFAGGAGVFSLLWGQTAGVVVGLILTVAVCARLKLLPARGRWGRPTWARFKELFSFGKDVFVFSLGSQMINMSQTILIAPLLGFEAAGIWAVCVRPFSLVSQVVWRVLDFSATPLSEMLVRGEHERFYTQFRAVTVLTGVMAVVMGTIFAVCNQPFVHLWTRGAVGWPVANDVLLAVWGVFLAVQRCHCGLLGVRKQLGTVKYVYLLEGLLFMSLAALSARTFGFGGILGSSMLATCSISFAFGLWRTHVDFKLSWGNVLGWLKPAGTSVLVLAPLAAALYWASNALSPGVRLGLLLGTLGPVGCLLLLRCGVDTATRERLAGRMPGWIKLFLSPGVTRRAV